MEKDIKGSVTDILPAFYYEEWSQDLTRQVNYLQEICDYRISQASLYLFEDQKDMAGIYLEEAFAASVLTENVAKYKIVRSLFCYNYGVSFFNSLKKEFEKEGRILAENDLHSWLLKDYNEKIMEAYSNGEKEKLIKYLSTEEPLTSPKESLIRDFFSFPL